MQDFLLFFDEIIQRRVFFKLFIDYTPIGGWSIRVEHVNKDTNVTTIVCDVEDVDVAFIFAKAHVALKDYLMKNCGGY